VSSQFQRLAETDRPSVTLTIDGAPVEAMVGDTVLTAILTHMRRVRMAEFGGEPRAGFCLMGACQDCWVGLADGRRLRACTSFVEAGMALETKGMALHGR
jgi:predicted molibdopterin-dependent oxidoreductase YjgC